MPRVLETENMKTIGEWIEELAALKREKAAKDEELKAINLQILSVEREIFDALDAQEITRSEGASASVSIVTSTKAEVIDREAFDEYVLESRNIHLYEKRVNSAACRELFERGEMIPGVLPKQYRRLHLRNK